MTVEQFRRYLKTPFRPFAIYLADGRILSVMHPELLSFSSSGRTADVHTFFRRFETIDILLVVSLRQLSDMELRNPFNR